MTFIKTYKTLPLTLDHGAGAYVWDTAGKRYLDMYAGHAVASTGHCHPKVTAAIAAQAEKLIFYSNVVELEIRARAAEKLLSYAPVGLTDLLFANSGAEAIENALKMAVLQTGRKRIITFDCSFHGRTLLAANVTGTEKYRQQAPFQLPEIVVANFADKEGIRSLINADTAAVIIEPVQSMAGCRRAAPGFYWLLRELTEKHGAYLIYDEVQTGIGRTGKLFFAGRYGVVPDIVCLAKGIASGVPLSAVLASKRLADKVEYGQFGATFAAGPLAMASMLATLEVIEQEQLLTRVKSVGAYLKEALSGIPGVEEVRGLGLLLGVKTAWPAAELQARLLERGVIVGTSEDRQVMRLLPPLILTIEQAEEFVTTFKEIVK